MKARLELFLEVRRLKKGYFIKKRKLDLCLAVIGGRRSSRCKNKLMVTDEELGEFINWMERNWNIVVEAPPKPNGVYILKREEV